MPVGFLLSRVIFTGLYVLYINLNILISSSSLKIIVYQLSIIEMVSHRIWTYSLRPCLSVVGKLDQ
jgi:hypothetical protein